MGPVRAGSLREWVTIQSRVNNPDEYGDPVPVWSTLAKVRGSLTPISGSESLTAGQVSANVSHRIIVRFRDTLNSEMQFIIRGRTFSLDSVINVDERDRLQECLATERTSGGS